MNDDFENNRPLDPQRFRQPDPHTREEIGSILEGAFLRESGIEPGEEERTHFRLLAQETEVKLQSAEHLAEEAEAAAKRAEIAYQHSQNESDLQSAMRWSQEAAAYRGEAHHLRQEVERLRKFDPDDRNG